MKEIENSIEETLETSDLENINVDLAEVAIDSIMDDGVLKDIPVVSTIVGLSKFGFKVRETIFLKKILKFLTQLETTSKAERQRFLKRVQTYEDYNNKVGLALVLILDKLEDLDKPKIIGKIFTACVKEEIDYKTFLKLSYLIEDLFLPDLQYLRSANEGKEIEIQKREELHRVGFMSRPILNIIRGDSKNEYEINEYGKQLIKILDKK